MDGSQADEKDKSLAEKTGTLDGFIHSSSLLSSLWVSHTGSTSDSDWCADCIATIHWFIQSSPPNGEPFTRRPNPQPTRIFSGARSLSFLSSCFLCKSTAFACRLLEQFYAAKAEKINS